MSNKRLNDTPVNSIPEVAAYQALKAQYDAFRAANRPFFEILDALQEDMNQKLQAAEKIVRSRGVSCGDFELYQYTTKYSAEELLQALGRDKFLQVGGKMTTETVYDIDRARFEASVTSGDVPKEVAERVRKVSPSFHKPKPMELP